MDSMRDASPSSNSSLPLSSFRRPPCTALSQPAATPAAVPPFNPLLSSAAVQVVMACRGGPSAPTVAAAGRFRNSRPAESRRGDPRQPRVTACGQTRGSDNKAPLSRAGPAGRRYSLSRARQSPAGRPNAPKRVVFSSLGENYDGCGATCLAASGVPMTTQTGRTGGISSGNAAAAVWGLQPNTHGIISHTPGSCRTVQHCRKSKMSIGSTPGESNGLQCISYPISSLARRKQIWTTSTRACDVLRSLTG